MFGCCSTNFCKDFKFNFEDTDKGVIIKVTGDDPKKVEALKSMLKSCNELCDCNDEKCC